MMDPKGTRLAFPFGFLFSWLLSIVRRLKKLTVKYSHLALYSRYSFISPPKLGKSQPNGVRGGSGVGVRLVEILDHGVVHTPGWDRYS